MNLSEYTFLVVDDHTLARRAVINELTKLQASPPDEATNGLEALEKIREKCEGGKPYDFVLLDWALPEMNGFEVLVECRKDSRLQDMCIIMVSAETEDENILKALAEGATAYIPKPFRSEVLIHKLNDVLGWKAGLPEIDGEG